MRRRAALGVLLALLITAAPAGAAPAGAAGAAPAGAAAAGAARATSRVLIVTLAGLTWEQVAAGQAPTVLRLGRAGSMAAMSIRTVDAPSDPASALASLGAGNKVKIDGPLSDRARLQRDNDRLHFGARLGSLGEALSTHGVPTGVSGTAGAALALGDTHGHVAADLPASGVGLLSLTGGAAAEDAALAGLLAPVDLSRDTVVVLGMPLGPPHDDLLTVAVAVGAGIPAGTLLTSATTHRSGLIALVDVAPGVLHLLEVPVPTDMSGQAFRPTAGPADRLAVLLGYQRGALAYRGRQAPFLAAFGVLAVAVVVGAAACLRRPGHDPASRLVRLAGLAVLAAPLASLVQTLAGAETWAALPSWAFVAGADVALVAVALAGPWRRYPLGPPVAVALAATAGIAADLVTGGAGQLSSYVGYSPIVGGRFYGMSALTFAVVATEVLLLAGLAARAWGRRPALVAGVAGLATLALAGSPFFGAKFGAILTLVPAFGLLCLLVAGRRVSLSRLALLAGATAVAALGLGILDALRPAASRTHLGRFVASLAGGGSSSLTDVLARKADTNVQIFVHTPASLLVPAILVALVVLVLRPPAPVAEALARARGLREGTLAALAANAVGLVVNDSGVAIPAMGISVGLALVLTVVLAPQPAHACTGPAPQARP